MHYATILIASLLWTSAPLTPVQDPEPPPGMVLIKGGKTVIGIPAKLAEKLGKESPGKFNIFARETPKHERRLEDFHLMVSEVTNEQYEAFVRVTGHKPAQEWGRLAIENAAREYAQRIGESKAAARAAGEPPPDFEKFEATRWWDQNWPTADWGVSKGHESKPVVFVDYQDAAAYARWAGLRLMTEFEFQRAGHGKTDQPYPWGDTWDSSRAVSQEDRVSGCMKVASKPEGATLEGVFDLCGNVWEWTSSPFTAYPKFKNLKIRVKDQGRERVIDGIPPWDPNNRVSMGGSFQNEAVAQRLTTRHTTERNQHTNALGFRCAASTTPGVDMASTILREDVPVSKRPSGVAYAHDLAVGTDRWQSEPGTARMNGGDDPVPNYAIITAYDHVLFIPVEKVDGVSIRDLTLTSHEEGPVHLGIFSTTKPTIVPELDPGSYLLTWRGAGAPKAERTANTGEEATDEDESVVEVELPENLDLEVENFIFYDIDMNPVAFLTAEQFNATHPVEPRVKVAPGTRQILETDDEGEVIVVDVPVDIAQFSLCCLAKVSNKGYVFELPIKFDKGHLGSDWR